MKAGTIMISQEQVIFFSTGITDSILQAESEHVM
jgi:hypothetical protein